MVVRPPLDVTATPSPSAPLEGLSRDAAPGESAQVVLRPYVPAWLVVGSVVMAGSAGYTLLAYLLSVWAS